MSLSKRNPELLDAGITAFFFFREREKDLGKAPLVGFFDFFKVRVENKQTNNQQIFMFIIFYNTTRRKLVK